MIYNELGRSGLKVSELTMGGTTATGRYGDESQHRQYYGAIEHALAAGVNLFDTAEGYGDGESEEILGKMLKGVRESVYIASKVARKNLLYNDVMKAAEGSLKRLQTDYIDIYFVHQPSLTVPIEETMQALLALKQQGRIRAIGLSNFTLADMKRAVAVGQVDAIQPCYNLLWRTIEKDVVPFCIENQIGIMPYSPLVQGILTGKFGRDQAMDRLDNRARILLFEKEWFGKCLDVVDGMLPVAEKHAKSRAQVAINWIGAQPGVTSVIVGGKNPGQIRENLGAIGWTLTAEDLAYLDRLSRTVTDFLPDRPSFWSR
jgi:myo-inositol catabolism protein IolS